jgi:hypothetical protein
VFLGLSIFVLFALFAIDLRVLSELRAKKTFSGLGEKTMAADPRRAAIWF